MTVDTFETRRADEAPQVTTVMRMATPTRPIPVPVDTFDTGGSKRGGDSYRNRHATLLRHSRGLPRHSRMLRGRLRTQTQRYKVNPWTQPLNRENYISKCDEVRMSLGTLLKTHLSLNLSATRQSKPRVREGCVAHRLAKRCRKCLPAPYEMSPLLLSNCSRLLIASGTHGFPHSAIMLGADANN